MLDSIAGTKASIGVGVMSVFFLAGSVAQYWTRAVDFIRSLFKQGGKVKINTLPADLLLGQIVANERPRELPAKVLDFMIGIAQADCGSILVRDQQTRRFVLREIHNANPGSFQIGDIDAFLAWLARQNSTVTRRALVDNPDFASVKSNGLQYCVQFHAEACVPLYYAGELLAVVNIGPRSDDREFSPKLCAQLAALAVPAAIAVQQCILVESCSSQRKEIGKVSELKTSFLSNLSHELRTPLTSIIGLSEHILEEKEHDPKDLKQYMTMMNESGKRLLATVTALLDLARLETNRQELDVRRISLARLLGEVSEKLKPTAATKLELELRDETPPIYGDANWVRTLLQHVLENAVKYTPQGKVWVDVERTGDMLKVAVHDTGIGIPKRFQKEVFNGFVQSESPLTRAYEGTGVGLAISRRVVELHGGRIWLESQQGEGSHIFFTLPLKPSAMI